jgi:hypothetical protein
MELCGFGEGEVMGVGIRCRLEMSDLELGWEVVSVTAASSADGVTIQSDVPVLFYSSSPQAQLMKQSTVESSYLLSDHG